jgi:hypothetical protein
LYDPRPTRSPNSNRLCTTFLLPGRPFGVDHGQRYCEAAHLPSSLNYGSLRLHPDWDNLRGDPRFEKIVASLAPK